MAFNQLTAEVLSSRASLYITQQALRQLETMLFSMKLELNPQTVLPICERTYIGRSIILRSVHDLTARTNINMVNTERLLCNVSNSTEAIVCAGNNPKMKHDLRRKC